MKNAKFRRLATMLVVALLFTALGGLQTAGATEVKSTYGRENLPASDVLAGEVDQQTYPLTKEKVTLEYWYPEAGSLGTLADYNDGEFWQWFEEKTNVHVDFILPAVGTVNEAFQLLFAAEDLPDIMRPQPFSGMVYRDGFDAAIDDGYFEEVTQHFEWIPNYVSWLNTLEDAGKAAYTDSGRMVGMWQVVKSMEEGVILANQGISIRKDFLDAVNMDIPTTYDEWEAVLTAFKDQLGIEAPLYTGQYGIDDGEFMAGYGVAPYFYHVGSEVKFGPVEAAYKDYLTLLHDWWEKGLLDRDFATRSSTGIAADNDMILNDKIGALVDWGTRMGTTYISRGASNENLFAVAAPQPKLSADAQDPAWFNCGTLYYDHLFNAMHVFKAGGEHLELAMRWVDAFYAKDVYENAHYGIESEEGIVWEKAEDGHRVGIYEFRYNNPDGLDSATVLAKYWVKNPPVFVEAAQIEQQPAAQQESYQTWSIYPPDDFMPTALSMTTEENSEYSKLYTDIQTYVQECNVKFIMGQMDLNDYDSYVETLRGMGVDRCIELQQAAFDRYMAR